jgi:hypothetical protein
VKHIETSFKEFTARDDVGIILISQAVCRFGLGVHLCATHCCLWSQVANSIRHVIVSHVKVGRLTFVQHYRLPFTSVGLHAGDSGCA